LITWENGTKPGDYACKGSLPNLLITWENGSKTNGTPDLACIPHLAGNLAGNNSLAIVVLYAGGNNQPEFNASKKAATDIIVKCQ